MTDQTARRPRWWMVALGIASAAVLVTSTAGAVVGVRLSGNVTALDISSQFEDARPPVALLDETGNYRPVNILLMGSDTRQGDGNNQGYGNPDVFSTDQSDTVILLHVAADRSRALAVSFPRDTWVTLPECSRNGKTVGGYESKFNAAYMLAGPGCTVKLVEQLTGLPVDHFAVIDFAGFKSVVDAMGGVEVCLTKAVNDPKSGLQLPAGTSVVKGEDALAFVRARKTLSDGSDIARIQRQQSFLSSMIRKATSTELLLNPVALVSMLDSATKSLTADPFLADLDNLRDLALSVRDLKPDRITFITAPWVEKGDGENVLLDKAQAEPIWQAIRDDQPWPPKNPDGQPRLVRPPSQILVKVLNGTGTSGLATKVATDLRSLGFIVIEVGDADRADYATTVVKYDPGFDESAKTLSWAVTGSTSTAVNGLGEALTVVVGKDYTGVRKPKVTTEDAITVPTTADKVKCA